MKSSSLINTLLSLRGMVERDSEKLIILQNIDSFTFELKNLEKHYLCSCTQLTELQTDSKKLKQKIKKMNSQVLKGEQECVTLKHQLDILNRRYRKDIVSTKSNKIIMPDLASYKKIQAQKQIKNCQIQCEILNYELVKQLNNKQYYLLQQLQNLQKQFEEERNENHAMRLYIDELMKALNSQEEEDEKESLNDNGGQSEKEQDNSTLDNQSQRNQDFELPNWLEQVETKEQFEEDDPIQKADEPNHSWFSSLWQRSSNLCAFIFRS